MEKFDCNGNSASVIYFQAVMWKKNHSPGTKQKDSQANLDFGSPKRKKPIWRKRLEISLLFCSRLSHSMKRDRDNC